MKNKVLIIATLVTVFLFFTISYSFATNNVSSDMVNGIRNFVGGAENTIENIGEGAANGIRSGMNTLENGAKNATNTVENGMNHISNDVNASTTETVDNNNNYTATRTAADTAGTNMLASIPNTVWSWLIVGIVGVLIIALVMYYAKQNNSITTYRGHDDDNDRN